jgi:hypothetical protein
VALKSATPALLFINDTDHDVSQTVVGPTSPSVHLSLKPGERQLVNMPWYIGWGEPQLPENVGPKYNFLVFKVYYLSAFPNPWWTHGEYFLSP